MRLAGEQLDADFVVAGVGVTPRVELAAQAGLDVDDGIVVDDAQRTSAAGIYAAGDVARPRDGARVEHWHAARESGERAALAMLGEPITARRTPWVFSEFAGAKLDVVGWAPRWDEIVPLAGGWAYVVGGDVAQLAIADSQLPVEEGRALVESGAPLERSRCWPALPALDARGGELGVRRRTGGPRSSLAQAPGLHPSHWTAERREDDRGFRRRLSRRLASRAVLRRDALVLSQLGTGSVALTSEGHSGTM